MNESSGSGIPEPGEPKLPPSTSVRGSGPGLLIKRRRFLWFALAVILLAIVLALTATFRVTGFVLAGLLLCLAVLRAAGREEAVLFAARSRAFDTTVLIGCAGGLVLFSIIAPT